MASKRQITLRSPSSTDSEAEHARKRIRSSSPASEREDSRTLKIYIVQAKVDEKELQQLFRLIDDSQANHRTNERLTRFELTINIAEADVIITNLRMKKRFERHIPWNIARKKSIVTPAWLRQSINDGRPAGCGPYAAFQELHDTHCTTNDVQESKQEGSSRLPYISLSPPHVGAKLTPRRVFENWNAKYACQRASPMVCLNQVLATELNVLARSRELEGLSMNALSYEKSVAV
jgi:DNA polymerase mu